MKKKFLSSCMIAFLAMGIASCSNDDNIITTEQQHPCAEGTSYISISLEKELQTRSSLEDDGSYLNFKWNAGDQLVVVDGTGVIGTLTTTAGSSDFADNGGSATADFEGTVEKELTDGETLRFYYLGNRSVANGDKEFVCDFSTQEGTLTSTASLRFAASDAVAMVKGADNVWSPSGTIALTTKISVLRFNITYNDGTSTYNASSCTINGVYTKATVDLVNNTYTADYTRNVLTNENVEAIRMSHTQAQNSLSYYVAVPVFEEKTFDNPNMTCTFFDASSTTKMKAWTSWTLNMGKAYPLVVSFTNDASTSYSQKGGYGGYDILGGGNNTDFSTKGGYSGNPVDGQADDPVVTKGGYTGNDVH